jgi:signal transduction histidine kinase
MAAATEQAIFATDTAGTVLMVNRGAERIFHRSEREMVGSDIVRVVTPDATTETGHSNDEGSPAGRRSPLHMLIGQAAEGGAHIVESDYVLPDGSRHTLELVVTPRPALAGPAPELPVGYLFVGTDITNRVEEARKQDEFIGLISHEFRTPLASILGYVDLLKLGGDQLDDEQLGYLAVVERNAQQLQSLVDALLMSAQLASGTDTLVAEEVDVVDVVRHVVLTARPVADAAGVRVEIDGEESVPLVSDADRLAHVVTNLVSNAAKYSNDGGLVTVTVRSGSRPDGTRLAILRVSDQGSGIAPDELMHITEPFYRSRETRRRRVRGVGLGLSLVQTIVDEHRGTVTFDSELGAGTTVEVTLPDLTVTAGPPP